jgi:DNA polymerase-3 subunit epsilon
VYAVIDLETTGLRAGGHDRVVEVAVVHVDGGGRVTYEWCSLVNPDRDLGPQAVHGITAAEVRRAPSFDQVAGHVADLLRGRALVAHNLRFDAGFLVAEYRRLGLDVPVADGSGLCTMYLASMFLPQAGRSLQACTRAAGLPPFEAHSALHDARAAAGLLARYLHGAGDPPPWHAALARAASAPWPRLGGPPVVAVPRGHGDQPRRHFLARLVDRQPHHPDPQVDAYLAVLDQALLDRHISDSEADALVAAAREYDLARVDVEEVHRRYLAGMAATALEDGVLTVAERDDLDLVARLVGLDSGDVDKALALVADTPPERRVESWRLHPGDVVVFTGAMRESREYWQDHARALGLVAGDGVTKKTRLLVAADPDTLSGKAKKARQYGIPVVHPAGYLELSRALT